MEKIEELLTTNRNLVLVNGIGGIGKTEISKKYFQSKENDFTHLMWVDYKENLRESFFTDFEYTYKTDNPKEAKNFVFNKICNELSNLNQNSLLVIDNLDNPEDEDLKLLESLPFQVLISSRNVMERFETYLLGFLSIEECKELFYKHYSRGDDDENLEEIISLAGNHTLTLELLAKTAEKAKLKIEELLSLLKEKGFNLSEAIPKKVETGYSDWNKDLFFEHLVKVFEFVKLSDEEIYVMKNFSVLPPIPIEDCDEDFFAERMVLKNSDSIESLVEKGWLLKENDAIWMHRVIQEIVRFKFQPEFKNCEKMINSFTILFQGNKYISYLKLQKYLPFGEAILFHFDIEENLISILFSNLSYLYRDIGNLVKSLEYQKKDIYIGEKLFGKNDIKLASSLNNLGGIYLALGNTSKSLKYHLKSLKIREKNLNEKHPSIAQSYNNISGVYKTIGNLTEALEYQKKSIQIYEDEIIKNKYFPELALSYNNLSMIFLELNKIDEALQTQLKSLKILKKTFDSEPEHPSFAQSYNNLSTINLKLKKFKKALKYQLKTLEIQDNIYAKEHLDFARTYNNLATIYMELKDFVKAEEFLVKTIKILTKNFVVNHPDLAVSKSNLSLIYINKKDYNKALELQLEAIDILETIGMIDPHQLGTSYKTLSWIYLYQNKIPKAINSCEKAINYFKSRQPPNINDIQKLKEMLEYFQSLQI